MSSTSADSAANGSGNSRASSSSSSLSSSSSSSSSSQTTDDSTATGPSLPAVAATAAVASSDSTDSGPQPTPELMQQRSHVMADFAAAADERNRLIEKEQRRLRKEDRYVKRTLETTVCKMLEVLQTERGKVILDQEALEIQKRRFRILEQLDHETFLEDVDLRNYILVKLFQLYDINKSASLSRSDFVGIVQECMGIHLKDSDVDRMFSSTNVNADFEAVSGFVQWKLRHQSKQKTRSQLHRMENLREKKKSQLNSGGGGGGGGATRASGSGKTKGKGGTTAGAKGTPTKEDFRIAQKMILEKLKLDTGKQARIKFRQKHPVFIDLPKDDPSIVEAANSYGSDAGRRTSAGSPMRRFGAPAVSEYERGASFRRMSVGSNAGHGDGPDDDDDAEWEANMAEESIMHSEWLLVQQEVKNKKGKLVKVWFKRPVFTQLVGQCLYSVDVQSLKKSFDLRKVGAAMHIGTRLVDRGNLSRILEEARNSDDLNLIISLSASDGRPGSQLFVRAHSVGQKIAWVQALFHVMQEEGDGMADSAVGGEGTSTTPRVAQPKIIENLWREADKCAMQGILIKLPTSTKTADAEKKLARAAASDSFFAQDQLPRGAEYRFFSLRGSVLSYYDFKWVFQSIVPQHGLDERCMMLGPGSKVLVDSAKKSAQPSQSQDDAKISNPEIAAALENGTTFTIAHPPVFLTFASPEKAKGLEWLQELSRASSAVNVLEASAHERVEMLYQGWFLKKGQNKTDRWRPRFFVYWTSGIVQYFEGGGDNSNEKPLGEINIARDAKEIRWSTDALIDKKSFPSPHCIEIVTSGRVWQLCPISDEKSEGAKAVHGGNKPARVLTRFMRLLESNLHRHKMSFSRHRMTVSGTDRQYVPRDANFSARTGKGMSAWQRISGNVPSSYVSYAEIKLIRLVADLAVNEQDGNDAQKEDDSSDSDEESKQNQSMGMASPKKIHYV
eukprot:INCI5375.3.p1 GENE.INCI5375.3~~INCI5375.3.p1  ORF type:complete len:956 (+),score=203.10 INCI5375.3:314-3181(+)